MKMHRSLTRLDVRRKGPAQIALMVASEFGRAASRASHRENVISCYARARELMGLLETIPLPFAVAARLKPIFARATEQQLLSENRLTPDFIQRSSLEFAEEFTKISLQIPA
jgi:hypothetical protein